MKDNTDKMAEVHNLPSQNLNLYTVAIYLAKLSYTVILFGSYIITVYLLCLTFSIRVE